MYDSRLSSSRLGKRKRSSPQAIQSRDDSKIKLSANRPLISGGDDGHISSDEDPGFSTASNDDEEGDDPVLDASSSSQSDENEAKDEEEDMQEVFRRAFEKRFAPLPAVKEDDDARRREKSLKQVMQQREKAARALGIEQQQDTGKPSDDDSDNEVWDGLDDDDDDEANGYAQAVEAAIDVVDYTATNAGEIDMDSFNPVGKSEGKRFMSSKPPICSAIPSSSSASTKRLSSKATADADDTTAQDAANDLALHRLISESHILVPNSSTLSHQTPTTKAASRTTRHAQNDLRLQRLGARASLSTLHASKMPMQHRVGILKKKTETEQRRRGEARDAGVILERERKEKGRDGGGKRRERSVGGPSVGKFRGGGTLVLGKDDVRGFVGARGRRGSSRGGGRGRGGTSGGRKKR